MANIPAHIVDEIMQTARIEEVIGEFVNLKRAGSNYKGLSPFTDERTPSFSVSPAKQIFKCFSSGKGGSVVTFLMEKEHFSYPEALKWLANKYGIVLPEEKPATAEELAAISEKESLFIINDYAKKYFADQMHDTEEGQNIGLSYFVERGFRPEIIKKFDLGYCPNKGDAFTQAAIGSGYKLEYLQTTGLVKSKDERNFDFFRGRVMFPIHSSSGRVLGFGGRTLISDKKVAKYFNSPESPIYHKSDILYGLYFAKGDIIKYDNCFLCEGYTDVISLHQSGLQNVVASSGTALTKEQIRLVRRFTQNITILYDGDSAGIKASFRGIDLILEEGMNVKVVLFPEGEDPDSYAKSHSSQELEEFVQSHSQDFVTFKTEILLKDSQNDPLKKAELIRDVVQSVSLIPDTITRNIYIQEVAQIFDISEQIIASEVTKKRAGNQGNTSLRPESKQSPQFQAPSESQATVALEKKPVDIYTFQEFSLIRVMVKYSVFAISTIHREENEEKEVETSVIELICHELAKDGLSFDYPLFHKIHEIFVEGLKEKTLFEPSFFLKNEDQELVKLISEIIDDKYELSPNWLAQHKIFTPGERDKIPQLIMDEIYHFKKSKIESRIKEIQIQLENLDPQDDEQFNVLLGEQVFLDRIKGTLARELNRIIH
ncbi:MAG: DNA primase [Bacteroidetes bacterium]|nr:DNA primase [Bacteroidota bacterium]